jgi:hypothetical protein
VTNVDAETWVCEQADGPEPEDEEDEEDEDADDESEAVLA